MRNVSIATRIGLLSATLLGILIASNLYLGQQLSRGADVLRQDERLVENLGAAVDASRAFGDLKYWLLELAVAARPGSREKALSARDAVLRGIDHLAAYDGEAAAVLTLEVGALLDTTMIALESYESGARGEGDDFLAKGLEHVRVVDQRLALLVRALDSEVAAARAAALAGALRGADLSWIVTWSGALIAAAFTLLVMRSIIGPLARLVEATNAISEGRLDAAIPAAGNDDIGSMSRALASFRDSLAEGARLKVWQEQAAADIRHSRERLTDAIESISDGFALYGPDDRLVMCNERYRDLVVAGGDVLMTPGTSFEDIIRGTVRLGLVQQAVGREEAWIRERLAQHRHPTGPHEHQREDGRWLQIHERATGDGGTVAVYTDITRLKARETALAAAIGEREKTVQELHALLDALWDGILFLDADLRARVCNRQFKRMWNLPEEFIERQPHMAELVAFNRHSGIYDVADEAFDEYVEARVAAVRTGTIEPYELRRADGRILEYQCEVLPDGGRLLIYFDVTDRKRAEDALRRSEERYALAMRGSNDGLWDWDLDRDRLYVSPRLREIAGLPADREVIDSRHWHGLLHPDDAAAHMAALARHLRGEAELFEAESRVRGEDGTYRWLQARGTALRGADGRAHRMAGSLADVNARKQWELELEQAKEEAEAATRTKSQFLANMSHELRTPLNAIIGLGEMLQEEAADRGEGEFREPLDRIVSASRHLSGLINEVLDLSKIEAGRLDLHVVRFDLGAVLDDVAVTAETLARQNDNRFAITRAGEVGSMLSDETRVRQILLNLLGNACKFTRGGDVRLGVEAEGGGHERRYVLRVTDNGIGMEEDEVERLFQEFTQADSSTTRRYGGTGLGLAITRRLCHLLGGTIDARSRPGEGTEFTVILPADAPAEVLAGGPDGAETDR